MENPKPQANADKTENHAPETKRGKRVIKKGEEPEMAIKKLLDLILIQAEGISPDLRDSLKAARDMAWNDFVKSQEAQMKLV